VIAGNALATLGACKDVTVLGMALPIALDRNRTQGLRESALSAIASVGDAAVIPTLVQHLDPSDPLNLTLVDCIGALTDAQSIPTVLPILLETDALVSSAFYRFRELQTHDAVDALLNVLLADPSLIGHNRLNSYAEPLWEALPRVWDAEWVPILATLIVAWEDADIYDREAKTAVEMLHELPDGGAQIAQAVLQQLLATGQHLRYFSIPLTRLITPAVAEWLAGQPNSAELMETAARFGSPEVRQTLSPHLGGFVQQQDRAIAEIQTQDQRRKAREQRRLTEQQHVMGTAQALGRVLEVASKVEGKDWPELDAARRDWLTTHTEDCLLRINPLTNVRWLSDNQLSYNPALVWLVRLIDHYGLHLGNDVLLVQSLLGVESNHVAGYHRRHGLSNPAIAEIERILADPATPSGAVYHFFSFLQETNVATPGIGRAFEALALDVQRPEHIRSWAIRLAFQKGIPDADLLRLSQQLDGDRRGQIEGFLIERQHRPTVERRIAALLADDAAMQAGEAGVAEESSLSWIAEVKSDLYWNRLVQLRAHSLRLALPNLAGLITGAMNKIDGVRLAAVIREQMNVTPPEWCDVQEMRAAEYEREGRLRAAQATPFERVIQRLRLATSLAMFKIWCEGLTDGPTIDQFLMKLPGTTELGIVTDSLGGWNNILSPNWRPDRLRDGCHDLIVLLDGDRGRDLGIAGQPLNANAIRVRQILEQVGVELFVLERYAIENYFGQAACEAFYGGNLSAIFPLPTHTAAPIPNHNKNNNRHIARHMSVGDLAGTDLLTILEEVVARSRV
jgi:hypothetical protein